MSNDELFEACKPMLLEHGPKVIIATGIYATDFSEALMDNATNKDADEDALLTSMANLYIGLSITRYLYGISEEELDKKIREQLAAQ